MYDHLSNNCYYFNDRELSWAESRKGCQAMSSELLSIESKYEQSFLQGMIQSLFTPATSQVAVMKTLKGPGFPKF